MTTTIEALGKRFFFQKEPRQPFGASDKKGRAFFSEEKKQKTFGPAVAESPSAYTQGNKSFLVLFFKKEPFALLLQVNTTDRCYET